MCSHPLAYPCNKDDSVQILPKHFFSHREISHWQTDANAEETSEEGSSNNFQHIPLVNLSNLPVWLHSASGWKPRSNVHSSGPRYYVTSEDKCHNLLYWKLFYCTTHENNKVTAGESQCHSNALSDQ